MLLVSADAISRSILVMLIAVAIKTAMGRFALSGWRTTMITVQRIILWTSINHIASALIATWCQGKMEIKESISGWEWLSLTWMARSVSHLMLAASFQHTKWKPLHIYQNKPGSIPIWTTYCYSKSLITWISKKSRSRSTEKSTEAVISWWCKTLPIRITMRHSSFHKLKDSAECAVTLKDPRLVTPLIHRVNNLSLTFQTSSHFLKPTDIRQIWLGSCLWRLTQISTY